MMSATVFAQRVASRRRRLIVIAVVVVTALILADVNGWLLVRSHNDMTAYHGVSTNVVRVIDGDTLEVDLPDALNEKPATRVMLWGVNCPEPARAGVAAEPFSNEATEFTSERVMQLQVSLWLESHQTRDAFGRVLAHVELPDRTKLNEALLEAGLAKTDERSPHSMLTRYAQLQLNAKRRGSGVWAVKSK